MNEDISNRTLAALLAITIVVSLGGTFFVLNNPVSISGFATNQNNDTGQVQFNLAEQINIYLSDDQIDMTGALVTGIRSLSDDGGSNPGQNPNGVDFFTLANNGTDAIDVNAYLDAAVNNTIWNVTDYGQDSYVCTSAVNGSTTEFCDSPISRPVNNSQVYASQAAASNSSTNCVNGIRGNATAVSLGNFTYATIDDYELCSGLEPGNNENTASFGVSLTTPVGQGSFTGSVFNVYFVATSAD